MDGSISLRNLDSLRQELWLILFITLAQNQMMVELNEWLKEKLSEWLHKLMNEGGDDE